LKIGGPSSYSKYKLVTNSKSTVKERWKESLNRSEKILKFYIYEHTE